MEAVACMTPKAVRASALGRTRQIAGVVAVWLFGIGAGCGVLGPAAPGSGPATEAAAAVPDMVQGRIVDLTYPFDSRTVYWPTSTPFQLARVARGTTDGGFWYAANDFCAAEHGGTHLDAPVHFAEDGWTLAEVPIERLVGLAAVVDIRSRASADADAELRVDDLLGWEARHGEIRPGAIVLLYSGWGTRWPDRGRYLGSAVPGDTAHLHFPGFSAAAAEFLVRERAVGAVGTDTASIDPGQSHDFLAHRVFAAANVPMLENLAFLHRLPPVGATLIALPIKIANGTGGPARVIAILPATSR